VKRLFAGWRMAYVKGTERHAACLFCALRRPGNDRARFVLERRGGAFTMLNAFPYNTGHLMVALRRHAGDLQAVRPAEVRDLWALATRAERALHRVYRPHGMNVGMNLGRSAGAGIEGHLHLHLVPRWNGDTNFMTTIGETKVLPEDLAETYDKLAAALAGRTPRGARAPRRKPRPASPSRRKAGG
jgi:ATP adenylyltransferase